MSAAFIAIAAVLCCAGAIVAFRPLMRRLGQVDRPGGHKRHAYPTPLCGGFGIVAAFALCGLVFAPTREFAGMLVGLAIMLALGAADDRRNVSAATRLVLQALAVLVGMIWIGQVRLEHLGALTGQQPIDLGAASWLFTLFATVGVVNAINMIDGMDGLAGGFALLVLMVFSAATGLGHGSTFGALILVAMGAVIGFLLFNLRAPWRRHASVFLGDAGSLALGFLLTWFAVQLSQGSGAVLRPVAMVWLFGLPLMDTGYLILSRRLRGTSPMRADRRHLHHLFVRSGLVPEVALYLWLAIAGVFMGVGLLGDYLHVAAWSMCAAFLATFCLYCILVHGGWYYLSSRRSAFSAK